MNAHIHLFVYNWLSCVEINENIIYAIAVHRMQCQKPKRGLHFHII